MMYNSLECYTLLSSVHEMDCLRVETVPVSGRSGAQSSVDSAYRSIHQFSKNRDLFGLLAFS